ncbi:competence protein ComEA [Enterococcus sp. DIV1094]|uniref:Competence protein ComEA n=2 Tax=Candidatus Enterococcus mangumiae TaxID=2230878 RepID=A0ABZ2SYN4_9ENTE|nr:helix-hairpin-helix domain-containing protein [Enterococcus sp. DIV1094]MBO0490727.1 helix-hairpin-helix domain-containing protein [Enterococcus sp. DIV1094]
MKKIVQEYLDSPKRIMGFIIVSLLLLSVSVVFIYRSNDSNPLNEFAEEPFMTYSSSTQESAISETTSERVMYVDVKGNVQQPGMYAFTDEERVFDIIQKAGGLTPKADEKQINFAAKVSDQQVLYIPEVGEVLPEFTAVTEEEELEDKKVNLNTASLTELQELPGIGVMKAQEIINYRETNGSFQTIESLKEISGFGEKTVEKLKNFVTITID